MVGCDLVLSIPANIAYPIFAVCLSLVCEQPQFLGMSALVALRTNAPIPPPALAKAWIKQDLWKLDTYTANVAPKTRYQPNLKHTFPPKPHYQPKAGLIGTVIFSRG